MTLIANAFGPGREVDALFGDSLLTGSVSGSGIRARACKRCSALVLDDQDELANHADHDDRVIALLAVLVPYPGEPDYPQRHGRESHGEVARCECPPCPGRGNDGHGMTHCAECCFGTFVEADPWCPIHGEIPTTAATQVAAAREVADTAARITQLEAQVAKGELAACAEVREDASEPYGGACVGMRRCVHLKRCPGYGLDGERLAHVCAACTDCLHDGHKCCGCYDGACCQPDP